jgi:hypothetical protein
MSSNVRDDTDDPADDRDLAVRTGRLCEDLLETSLAVVIIAHWTYDAGCGRRQRSATQHRRLLLLKEQMCLCLMCEQLLYPT